MKNRATSENPGFLNRNLNPHPNPSQILIKSKTKGSKPSTVPLARPSADCGSARLVLRTVLFTCAVTLTVQSADLSPTNPRGTNGPSKQPPTLTFNKDIAPIVFEHCAGCHRPGQSAPFTLLSFAEV